ncbi:MAG: DUF2325 domain-containing protein [Deltaproteobacteria bacterium]|nr:DUF2325 domain-containing protein [Deltaproteobacteria bacterium]
MPEILAKINPEDFLSCNMLQLKRIWEIQNNFKCPVLGSCLTIEEHKRILKKTGHKIKKIKAHEVHRAVMGYMNDENHVSIKIDRYLSHKYRNIIAEFKSLAPEAFFAEWKNGFRNGKMDGLFYLAAIRNDLPDEFMENIFGDTHMLCHANMEEVMKSRRAFSMQENAAQKLARMLQQEKRLARELKQKYSITEQKLKTAEHNLQKIKKSQSTDKSYAPILQIKKEEVQLKDKITTLKERDSEQTLEIRNMQNENRSLRTQLLDLQSINYRLAEEVSDLIEKLTPCFEQGNQCQEKCIKYQLCSKRILIVGGITKIKHLYKQLVESSGGEFDYHDGYMNNGKINIESRVMRADLVICPVNCNSHNACQMVKKLCRKFDRSVKMLANSSLSSISDALLQESVSLN